MPVSMVLGERHPTRVAAVFSNAREAYRAARSLASEADLSSGQIRVVDPNDPLVDHKLQPETSGVARTLVRSHLVFGIVGLSSGLLAGAAIIASGVEFAVSQPMMVLVSFGALASVIGLLAAGLLWARPNHQRVLARVKDAACDGNWTVVAHTSTRQQLDHARDVLNRRADDLSRTR